jgi:hypothetical protein
MITVYGKIFDKVRPDWHLLKCTMCTGWWVGMLVWLFMDLSFPWILAGFISSGTSYLLSKIVNDEGIVVKLDKD